MKIKLREGRKPRWYGVFFVRKHAPTTIWHLVRGLVLWPGLPRFVRWRYYGDGMCEQARTDLHFSVEQG